MKRYILIVAAVALATVSCSRHYDVNTPDPQAIGFGTWAEQLTKARAITEGAFGNGDSFNVFGSKTLSGEQSVVFNGDVVTNESGDWTYSPARFWDPLATQYVFFAISPSGFISGLDATAKQTAAKTGVFTTDALAFSGTVGDDIMIAKKTTVTPSGGAYSNPVTLDFQHAASLLDVKVKKSYSLKDATVAITSIKLENIVNKGTLSVSSYVTTDGDDLNKPVLAISNWTPASSEPTTTFTGTPTSAAPVTLNQYGYESVSGEALSGTANYFWQNFVVMPQTLVAANGSNPQQIKISYTITTTVGEVTTFTDKVVAFSAFDITDDKTNNGTPAVAAEAGWNPNTHYIYTLTLDANKIEFAATITPWATTSVNGYHNLIN